MSDKSIHAKLRELVKKMESDRIAFSDGHDGYAEGYADALDIYAAALESILKEHGE